MAISHCYWHQVVKNGNFTQLLMSSHQRMAISHCYWDLVIKNGNFTLLLTSSGQEWLLADLPLDLLAGLCLQMHHGIYIMGCIWQSFWILQEKLGISFFFWIIRFVNIQLELYSHVRCNPHWHSQHPQNTPKTPPHDSYKFQQWGIMWGGNFLLFLNN